MLQRLSLTTAVLRSTRRTLVLTVLLGATWPAAGHGPVPVQEIEVSPGRILIKVAEGVDLDDRFGGLVPHSPQMATLNSKAKAHKVKRLFPQLNSVAMDRLEERAYRGLSAPAPDLRARMAELGRWFEVSIDPALDPVPLAAQYTALDEVETAEPDYLMRLVEDETSSVGSLASPGPPNEQPVR